MYPVRPDCVVRVIYHGFSGASEDAKTAPACRPARPYFLFVGPRFAYKNFGRMAEAFASSAALRGRRRRSVRPVRKRCGLRLPVAVGGLRASDP
jgi:hypothetical protein